MLATLARTHASIKESFASLCLTTLHTRAQVRIPGAEISTETVESSCMRICHETMLTQVMHMHVFQQYKVASCPEIWSSDDLQSYGWSQTSQFGEVILSTTDPCVCTPTVFSTQDGIVHEIGRRLGWWDRSTGGWTVEFGGGDGKTYSNSYHILNTHQQGPSTPTRTHACTTHARTHARTHASVHRACAQVHRRGVV